MNYQESLPMFDPKKVRGLLVANGYNVRSFARYLKELNSEDPLMSEQTLYKKLNGEVAFTVDELIFICKLLGVEPTSFF